MNTPQQGARFTLLWQESFYHVKVECSSEQKYEGKLVPGGDLSWQDDPPDDWIKQMVMRLYAQAKSVRDSSKKCVYPRRIHRWRQAKTTK